MEFFLELHTTNIEILEVIIGASLSTGKGESTRI
jgi:hypothetical protein